MKTEKKSLFEKLNSKKTTAIFTLIAAVYGFFIKVQSDKLNNAATELNNLHTKVDTELRQKEFENNLKLAIYQEVKSAIEKKDDSSFQNATLVIVNEMLKEDSAYREKLKTILFTSKHSDELIATQKNIDDFLDEQKTIKKENLKSDAYRIDVFYLEDLPQESKPLASSVVSLLNKKYPGNDVRLRPLPKVINAQRGYRINSNQIRCEAGEKALATEILKEIADRQIFKNEDPTLFLINNNTPNYISIFIRNM